jgi:hypothetical protein
MHQVEVLFVLCSLLGGKRKVDVQNRLGRAGLVPVLNAVFDHIRWGDKEGQGHGCPSTAGDGGSSSGTGAGGMSGGGDDREMHPHGPGCDCNPESALKVQFLRLVHNFCDRDCDSRAHKWQMLSEGQIDAVRCMAAEWGDPLSRQGESIGPPSVGHMGQLGLVTHTVGFGGPGVAHGESGDIGTEGKEVGGGEGGTDGKEGKEGKEGKVMTDGLLSKLLAVLMKEPPKSTLSL